MGITVGNRYYVGIFPFGILVEILSVEPGQYAWFLECYNKTKKIKEKMVR